MASSANPLPRPRPMGPLYPPTPPPPKPAPPAAPDPWHHEHPILATVLGLGFAAALVLACFLLAPRAASSDPYVPLPDYDFYGRGSHPIVLIFDNDYLNYLNLSVRPSLLAISVSFGGVACSAMQQDAPATQGHLRETRDLARAALNESKRIVPPPALQTLHGKVQKVFQQTVDTVDALQDCMQSGGSSGSCPDAQHQTSDLMDAVVSLTDEVRGKVGAGLA